MKKFDARYYERKEEMSIEVFDLIEGRLGLDKTISGGMINVSVEDNDTAEYKDWQINAISIDRFKNCKIISVHNTETKESKNLAFLKMEDIKNLMDMIEKIN